MSGSLIAGCLWVLAAAVTALLPMRRQYPPGIALLCAAPLVIAAIGWQHGVAAGLAATAAFASMFRNPLIHLLWRRAAGRRTEEQG